jgi:hypothetical protein
VVVYSKPRVERFGTFRELTMTGTNGGGDGCIVLDPVTGAVVDGNPADGEYGTFPNGSGGTVTLPYCSNDTF